MNLLSRFRSCSRGAAAIEFAIIALALVLVCVGTIEFGRAFYVRNNIAHAADIAARRAMMPGTLSDEDLAAEVRRAFTGADPEQLFVESGIETVNGLEFRTISISYSLRLLVPGLLPDTVSLQLSRRIPQV